MSAQTQTPDAPSLAERLGPTQIGLRQDLDVTRHVFRGEPAYVLRDPMTFQSHRVSPADYRVLVRLDASRPLRDVFADLVAENTLTTDDEEAFYQFIVSLHRLNFLNLPISDEKLLYRRFLAKRSARNREKFMAFLFFRVPLWNPDAFLQQTARWVRPIFSTWAFMAWVAVLVAAGAVAWTQRAQLGEPLQGLLAAQNLPLIWVTLIVLKVLHEFGHAYACKHYGGYVPEMGAYIILFTPCAYVDATACWGFTRRRDRLIVCLAGMYVEVFIAAVAVFVWASTGPSLLNALAYNVIFLAGTTTVLFNVNPLMRYDGYYVLSELTEIPNLRQRSTQYVIDMMKRVFVGVQGGERPAGRRLRATLLTFGIAAGVYKVMLLVVISALIASKLFFVGIGAAAVYIGMTLVRTLTRMTRYLWYGEEAAPVRARAVAVGVVALIALPLGAALIPVPSRVQAAGVLRTEDEIVIHAAAPGFVTAAPLDAGQLVAASDLLVALANDSLVDTRDVAVAQVQVSEHRVDIFRATETTRLQQEYENLALHQARLDHARDELHRLTVRAPSAGVVVNALRERDLGRFIDRGDPIATIAAGPWQVRAVLGEDQLASARPKIGDPVEFRCAANPDRVIVGHVAQVMPAGSRVVAHSTLTHLGGGDIAVNPLTGEATRPYFEITVSLPDVDVPAFRHGMTGRIQLRGAPEPLLHGVLRSVMQFLDRLMLE